MESSRAASVTSTIRGSRVIASVPRYRLHVPVRLWRASSSKDVLGAVVLAHIKELPPRVIALLLWFGGFAGPAATPSAIRFQEVAVKSGLRFELRNGATGQFHQIEL